MYRWCKWEYGKLSSVFLSETALNILLMMPFAAAYPSGESCASKISSMMDARSQWNVLVSTSYHISTVESGEWPRLVTQSGYDSRLRSGGSQAPPQLSQSPLYQLLCDDRPSLRDGDGDAYDRDGEYSE
jgi:hypothetical protein